MSLKKSNQNLRGTHELINQNRPKLYKETQVSVEYNISLSWLRNSRWRGDGPQFVKIGGGVFFIGQKTLTHSLRRI